MDELGKRQIYDHTNMLPSFYIVSENKVLLLGWEFTRMADCPSDVTHGEPGQFVVKSATKRALYLANPFASRGYSLFP